MAEAGLRCRAPCWRAPVRVPCLLGEAGLLANCDATIHWGYVKTLTNNYPGVTVKLNRSLVLSGEAQRIIMAGGGSQLAGPGTLSHRPPRRTEGGDRGRQRSICCNGTIWGSNRSPLGAIRRRRMMRSSTDARTGSRRTTAPPLRSPPWWSVSGSAGAHVHPALSRGNRPDAARLCPCPPARRGQADAGDQRPVASKPLPTKSAMRTRAFSAGCSAARSVSHPASTAVALACCAGL